MELFPLCVNVENKTFLIVGNGKVAKEKVSSLSRFKVNILVKETFSEEDLEDADFVIGATSDHDVNTAIYEACVQRDLPVDIVNDTAKCTFVMPAMVKRNDLCVAITTGGKSPAYAALLRRQIEEIVPEDIETILDKMSDLRTVAKERFATQEERSRFLREQLSDLLADLAGVSSDPTN